MQRQPSPPSIQIEERNGRIVGIRVRHVGRLPPLPARFGPDVVNRALRMSRSRFEHRVLTAARKLGRAGYRVVERSLIVARCEQVVERNDAKRASFRAKAAKLAGEKKSPAAGRNYSSELSLTEQLRRSWDVDAATPAPVHERGRGR